MKLKECIKSGQHLTECDQDGFCNHCGCQDGGDYDETELRSEYESTYLHYFKDKAISFEAWLIEYKGI